MYKINKQLIHKPALCEEYPDEISSSFNNQNVSKIYDSFQVSMFMNNTQSSERPEKPTFQYNNENTYGFYSNN